MSDALEEHDGKVSICGRNITDLRFADDTDALAEEEQELEALAESLNKTCTRYKMEISAEKTKLMTNSANGIQREIKEMEMEQEVTEVIPLRNKNGAKDTGTPKHYKYLNGHIISPNA